MDENDPERRISELERQLSDAMPADSATSPASAMPGQQAWYPQPSSNWQQPAQKYRRLPFSPRTLIVPAVALVILGIGVAVVMNFNPFASKQLQTADGLNGLLSDIREKFGDTMGYELTVYPDHAIIERVDPADSRVEKGYFYNSGGWSDWGHPSAANRVSGVVDLSQFDVAGVAATIAKAPQTLTITNPDYSYLIVQGGSHGKIDLSVYTTDGLSAHMDITADGSITKLYLPS